MTANDMPMAAPDGATRSESDPVTPERIALDPPTSRSGTNGDVRLVAFDLDGTVLDETGAPSREAVRTLRDLLARGVELAAISGRSIRRCLLGLQGYPDVATAIHLCGYNGGVAVAPESGRQRELLFARRLDAEVSRRLATYAGERDLNLVYCYCEPVGGGLEEEYRFRFPTGDGLRTASWVKAGHVLDSQLLDRVRDGVYGPPPKMMLFTPPGAHEATVADLRARFHDSIYVAWATPELLEIMPRQVNKGEALAHLAQRLDVDLRQAVAIGDGNNDLPMLRRAGTGLLMGNAADSVRREATDADIHIVPTFAEEGFARALRAHVS